MGNCFECKHQNIQETSHEWIECLCKRDNKWHSVFRECKDFEKQNENEDL